MPIRSFRNLEVWQRSMELVEEVYRCTASFPNEERYGLTSQMRRASISIPTNVAEGHCRRSTAAYAHHVDIAKGSHGELDTEIETSRRLGFLKPGQDKRLVELCDAVGHMLIPLQQSLEQKLRTDPRR